MRTSSAASRVPEPVELPRIDPVGIVRYPEGYEGAPRAYSRGLRAVTLAVLVAFALVMVVTTGLTLGRYCLTTDAGAPGAFPAAAPRTPPR